MKRVVLSLLACAIILLCAPPAAFAAANPAAGEPSALPALPDSELPSAAAQSGAQSQGADSGPAVTAEGAILIEQSTGNILYSKNIHERMYPASMTKLMTCMIVLDNLKPADTVVVGPEISAVPADASKAGNFAGETITVENIIRALMVPSGDDTACVAAMAVAKKVKGVNSLDFDAAETVFADLMNKKAKALGAAETNFVNPHGYHDDNHYTTPYDMAIIARAAIQYDLIRRMAAEKSFAGNGAGQSITPGSKLKTKEYNWNTRNLLIVDGQYYYPYATGLKTGFTDQAGSCLAGSATKDGVGLISVLMRDTDTGRWVDTQTLMEYGFNNFSFQTIQTEGATVTSIGVSNTVKGSNDTLELTGVSKITDFAANDIADTLQKQITYDPKYLVTDEKTGARTLKAPIKQGDIVGKISYTKDGAAVYSSDIAASRDVAERTFGTDVSYYLKKARDAVFSPVGLGVIAAAAIVIIIAAIAGVRRRNRNDFRYGGRRRY